MIGKIGIGIVVAAMVTSAAALAGPGDRTSAYEQIQQIEVTFHQAAATHDLDLMVSLFADDATLSAGGKTYVGKDQIRSFFSSAGAFQPGNHWAAYTPAYKIRITENGAQGTLYFECLYVDVSTGAITAHTNSDDTVVRSGGKWLIHTMKAAKVEGF